MVNFQFSSYNDIFRRRVRSGMSDKVAFKYKNSIYDSYKSPPYPAFDVALRIIAEAKTSSKAVVRPFES